MAENIFSSFNVSGQGLSLQRMRLASVAKNIANASTTKAENGKPYEREVVVVRGNKQSAFDKAFETQIALEGSNAAHAPNARMANPNDKPKILSAVVARDNSPARKVYDPGHPDANDEGYVEMPNVNIVTEMVEMISAQRAFEANTQVVASAKLIARESLEI